MRLPWRPLLAPAVLTAALPAAAWQTRLADTPASSRPFDVATFGEGDVLTVGRIVAPAGDEDGAVVRLGGADGSETWRVLVAGTTDGADDILRRSVVADDGNVLVAGQIANQDTATDAVIVKLAGPSGAVVWRAEIDGGAALGDDAQDVAALGGGDVVATGREATGDERLLAVWRLDGRSGARRWTAHVPGTDGVGRRVVVAGDVLVVAGERAGEAGGDDVVVARLDPEDGAVLWATSVSGDAGTTDRINDLALDGSTVVVVGALGRDAGSSEFAVVALRVADGTPAWQAALDGGASGAADTDQARAVAIAPGGDVLVAGELANVVTGEDFTVVRLAAGDGTIDWRVEFDGGNESNDQAWDVAVGADGTVVAGGRLRIPGRGSDLALLTFALADGTERWRALVDGDASGADLAHAVAVDGAGDVVAAGRTRNGDGADEFTVVKRSAATGASYPCGDGVVDPGEQCDDANLTLDDGCRPDCTAERCGDGILDRGEACEPVAGDACCTPVCETITAGTACDDGDACTRTDRCADGRCRGTDPVVCPAPSDCLRSGCDPATGTCMSTPVLDLTRCEDGNVCTLSDRCRGGTCESGPPAECNDDDPCTADGCDPAAGCIFTEFGGVESVRCTIDLALLDRQCPAGLPRPLARRIVRAGDLLTKMEANSKPHRARRLLKKTARVARAGGKRTQRLLRRQRLTTACAAAAVQVFADLELRARALRDAL